MYTYNTDESVDRSKESPHVINGRAVINQRADTATAARNGGGCGLPFGRMRAAGGRSYNGRLA